MKNIKTMMIVASMATFIGCFSGMASVITMKGGYYGGALTKRQCDQVNNEKGAVLLVHGDGCSHCENFLAEVYLPVSEEPAFQKRIFYQVVVDMPTVGVNGFCGFNVSSFPTTFENGMKSVYPEGGALDKAKFSNWLNLIHGWQGA